METVTCRFVAHRIYGRLVLTRLAVIHAELPREDGRGTSARLQRVAGADVYKQTLVPAGTPAIAPAAKHFGAGWARNAQVGLLPSGDDDTSLLDAPFGSGAQLCARRDDIERRRPGVPVVHNPKPRGLPLGPYNLRETTAEVSPQKFVGEMDATAVNNRAAGGTGNLTGRLRFGRRNQVPTRHHRVQRRRPRDRPTRARRTRQHMRTPGGRRPQPPASGKRGRVRHQHPSHKAYRKHNTADGWNPPHVHPPRSRKQAAPASRTPDPTVIPRCRSSETPAVSAGVGVPRARALCGQARLGRQSAKPVRDITLVTRMRCTTSKQAYRRRRWRVRWATAT
jgi:hypothetical protein